MKDVLGNHLKDRFFHFGSLVEYHPITVKDQSRIHQFWKESLTWIVPRIRFVRGGIWKDDVLVADLEELETNDASEKNSERLNAKGSGVSRSKWKNYFFNRRWTNQNPLEEIRNLRTSTLIRERPIHGENQY